MIKISYACSPKWTSFLWSTGFTALSVTSKNGCTRKEQGKLEWHQNAKQLHCNLQFNGEVPFCTPSPAQQGAAFGLKWKKGKKKLKFVWQKEKNIGNNDSSSTVKTVEILQDLSAFGSLRAKCVTEFAAGFCRRHLSRSTGPGQHCSRAQSRFDHIIPILG